jgi:hypothetical protein
MAPKGFNSLDLLGECSSHPFPKWVSADCSQDWEICVPRDRLEAACRLLKSGTPSQIYEPAPPSKDRLRSIIHTRPRFKLRALSLFFVLTPDDDHFDCSKPLNIERSFLGLPYPKLEPYAQSLLDIRDLVPLTDLVDGMDLTRNGAKRISISRGARMSHGQSGKTRRLTRSFPTPMSPFGTKRWLVQSAPQKPGQRLSAQRNGG